jgi:F-type H+-transporting ATPase subunit epsilon
MPPTFLFELVSPEKLLFSGDVEQVTIPGEEGDFGVLAHHAPLISTVRPGVIRVWQNGRVTQTVFVSGGFAEVTQDRCTMLADAAEEVSKIDAAKAQAEYQQYLAAESPTATDHQAKVAQERKLAIARARVAAGGVSVPMNSQQPERVGAH